jgi:hypothetical protein
LLVGESHARARGEGEARQMARGRVPGGAHGRGGGGDGRVEGARPRLSSAFGSDDANFTGEADRANGIVAVIETSEWRARVEPTRPRQEPRSKSRTVGDR